MNDITFSDIQKFYTRYKTYIVPIVTIVTCAFLFLLVVIPQIEDLFITKGLEVEYKEKNKILQANLAFLKNLDVQVLDSHVNLVSSGLPLDKDYVGVINAISLAANTSGIELQDYDFIVGSLSKSENTENKETLNVDLLVKGNLDMVKAFILQLEEMLPLMQVNSIEKTSGEAFLIKTNFYYMFSGDIHFDSFSPLTPLSAKDQSVLTKIAPWSLTSNEQDQTEPSTPVEPTKSVSPLPSQDQKESTSSASANFL